MKKVLLPVCAGILLLASCKENDPAIDFGRRAADSTYLLTGAELSGLTTDAHQALVEEFTGQSCANCPAGHADLEAYAAANPGRLNYIGLYEINGGSLTQPPPGAANDFEDSAAYDIGKYVSGASVGSFPTAFIDRVPDVSDGILVSRGNWDGDITTRNAISDSLNLSVSSTYAGSVATITVKVTYTKAVMSAQALSVMLVEDSIIDYQTDNRTGHSLTDSSYLFTNVLRDKISADIGSTILDTIAVKVPGRVFRRIYTYALPTVLKGSHPAAINPAHCRVVAFVSIPGSGGNFEIMQSAQTKLMGP